MRVRSLHMKNYKRFSDLKIDLGDHPARIVALVGPNGSGKSSVFDAMLFADHHSDIGDTGDRTSLYHRMAGVDSPASVEVEFLEGDYYSVRAKKLLENRENTIFSIRSPYRFSDGHAVSAGAPIARNSYGASDFSALDRKMNENYARLFRKYREYMDEKDCRPSEAKSHIMKELNASIERCLPLAIESLGDMDADETEILFTKKGQRGSIPFCVLSSGEKAIIDLLLDLYIRKDVFEDSVFLIDEPEIYAEPAVQKKLIREICALVGRGSQIWITAKSPSMIKALSSDLKEDVQFLFFPAENEWYDKDYIIMPVKPSREVWKKVFSATIDDIASLVVPKRIIYCDSRKSQERTNAEKGFDAKFYHQIFIEKYPETLFFSSTGGSDAKDSNFLAVTLLQGKHEGTEAIILSERDPVMDEKQRIEALEHASEGTRILKRLDIENYLFDKEVLKKYCQAKNFRFDEFAYNDYVTDIINQNVRDRTGFIKNFCGITVSMSPVEFKTQLVDYITEDMNVYKELEQVIFEKK